MKRTRTEKSWDSMHQRCGNPKAANYYKYGAQGITVCDRWSSFAAFYQDMGERPVGTTLDRVDGSLGYGPNNCRWATAKEQNRNRRGCLGPCRAAWVASLLKLGMSRKELARLFGVCKQTISNVASGRSYK